MKEVEFYEHLALEEAMKAAETFYEECKHRYSVSRSSLMDKFSKRAAKGYFLKACAVCGSRPKVTWRGSQWGDDCTIQCADYCKQPDNLHRTKTVRGSGVFAFIEWNRS